MLTVTLPPSLTALRSLSNLLYLLRGQHPDGLPRQRVQMLQRPSACYHANRLGKSRWGLDYVVTTIGQSWKR